MFHGMTLFFLRRKWQRDGGGGVLASTAGLRVFSFILLAGLLAPKARSSETVWKDQASSSQISSRDNSHGIYSAFESSQTGVELLTHAGSRIKTVLFAAMVGGVCTSDDWRGDLPRYLMKFLPEARGDMIYARFLGQPQLGHDPFCQACTANGTDEGIAGGGCFDITAGSAPESVDLLVVIGSGKAFHCSNAMRELKRDECDSSKAAHWPALQWIMRSPIVTEKTLTIHVPIRNIWELQHNKLFGFDHVVLDSSFSKPLSQDSVDELRKACGEATQARKDGAASLIYVARYTKAKGQLDFLRLVDPKWLKGYTIRFFGAGMGETNIVSAMREAATERGLSIEIHNAVRKEDLLVEYCMSHGQIHYSSSDSNPRSPYEGLNAGLPVLVTHESNLPRDVYRHSSVFGVNHGDIQGEMGLESQFPRFMGAVGHQPGLRAHYMMAADHWLSPHQVYGRICQEIAAACKRNWKDVTRAGDAIETRNRFAT